MSFFVFSRSAFGVTVAGEWSNGFNDCGLFLNGVGGSYSYGGNCADWQDSSNWSAGTKAGLMAFSSASMDALRDWFFWTWKVGPGYFLLILVSPTYQIRVYSIDWQFDSWDRRISSVVVSVGSSWRLDAYRPADGSRNMWTWFRSNIPPILQAMDDRRCRCGHN